MELWIWYVHTYSVDMAKISTVHLQFLLGVYNWPAQCYSLSRYVGENGRLGHGDTVHRRHFTRVSFSEIDDSAVVHVSCGSHYTIIALASGTLCGFGQNGKGQLGTSPSQSVLSVSTMKTMRLGSVNSFHVDLL